MSYDNKMTEEEMRKRIMKPILKHGMDVSVTMLEAYVKYIRELINLRKTGVSSQ